jgi:hypothetical protein
MTGMTATDPSGPEGRNPSRLYLACGMLMLMVLALDLAVPSGVAIGVLYIVPVLVSLSCYQKRFTVFIAVASTIFIILDYFLQPPVLEIWKVISNRAIALVVIWVTASLGLQRRIAEQKRENAVREREKVLEDIRILRGFLPICAWCKKIRDDEGYWTQIEEYIQRHSEADFSHGICPECAKKLSPESYMKKEVDKNIKI